MILLLATELGKDPLLRNQVRKLFHHEARVTVEPTDQAHC
jgi:transcription elongation factor SPT6